MFQLKTLRSKNYVVKVDRWWKPSERRAARLLLGYQEHEAQQRAAAEAAKHKRDDEYGAG